MGLSVERISHSFVGRVSGIDLAADHTANKIAQVRAALNEHSILVFNDQTMSNAEQVRFSQKFGASEIHTVKQYLLPDFPEIIALANRGEAGTKPIANGGAYWHSDITYKAKPPMASLLYALEVPPEDGDTLFCDMAAAYAGLSGPMQQQLKGLRAIHSYLPRFLASRQIDASFDAVKFELSEEQKQELAPVTHPIVRTHPETGRKALFVNEGFTTGVEGLGEEPAQQLLQKLNAHVTQSEYIYRHQWQVGDVVFWDNRTTMHCATDYDKQYARRMHRTTVQGDTPV
jgi:taurine dioxygenase